MLLTCPAASGLRSSARAAGFDGTFADTSVFHFAASSDPNCERSTGAPSVGGVGPSSVGSRGGTEQGAIIPSPNSTRAVFDRWSISMMRPVTVSPAACSARNSSSPVGTICLIDSFSCRFSRSISSTAAFTTSPTRSASDRRYSLFSSVISEI